MSIAVLRASLDTLTDKKLTPFKLNCTNNNAVLSFYWVLGTGYWVLGILTSCNDNYVLALKYSLALAGGIKTWSGFPAHILYSFKIRRRLLTPEQSNTLGILLRGAHQQVIRVEKLVRLPPPHSNYLSVFQKNLH